MDIGNLILKKLMKKGEVRVADIVKTTGFSREYVSRFFKRLKEEGKIVLVGKANQARYLPAEKHIVAKAKEKLLFFRKELSNKKAQEDVVLNDIKRNAGIFSHLPQNIINIVDYAFTEMLNNAIEHSHSSKIQVVMERENKAVRFEVIDRGIGIFSSLIKKRGFRNELEAIQELTKGKLTTAPKAHSGEGIFFTSRVADLLVIQSAHKKLIFDNILDDIFLKDIKHFSGTKVSFLIGLTAKQRLGDVFKEYAGDTFEFSKTKVIVKLYKTDTEYISRSQARRVLGGLEKFKIVVFDFKNVETIGQAFADEVFRVWQIRHPKIELQCQNANENTKFMIKRASKRE